MVDYLNRYGYAPDRDAIGRALDIIAANLDNVASEQVYKDCFSMMDLTTLKTDDTPASVRKSFILLIWDLLVHILAFRDSLSLQSGKDSYTS